jgi:hypothetical protein
MTDEKVKILIVEDDIKLNEGVRQVSLAILMDFG